MNKIGIEVMGLYDGVAVWYDREKDTFEWREVVIERTTDESRKEMETNFRKQFKKNENEEVQVD